MWFIEQHKKVLLIAASIIAISLIALGVLLFGKSSEEQGQIHLNQNIGYEAEEQYEFLKYVAYVKTRDEEFYIGIRRKSDKSLEAWKFGLDGTVQEYLMSENEIKRVSSVLQDLGSASNILEISRIMKFKDGRLEPKSENDVLSGLISSEVTENGHIWQITEAETQKYITQLLYEGYDILEYIQMNSDNTIYADLLLVAPENEELVRLSFSSKGLNDTNTYVVEQRGDKFSSFLGKAGIIDQTGYRVE